VSDQQNLPAVLAGEIERRALLEAIIYVAEEPLTVDQIAAGLELPVDMVQADLDALVELTGKAERGIEVRAVAGGYKMSTKAEHHEAVRKFVKTLRPKLKLSLPALETLAVIAYKQPVTLPEIQAIRGVNANAVIHTLLNHKLVTTAGRKQVIGKPMQYKTTKEFLVQFGLKDLAELPSLKELEELSRAVLGDSEEGIEPAVATGRAENVGAPGRELTEEETGEETDELTGATGDEDGEAGEFEPEAEEELPEHAEDRVSEHENEEPETGEIEAETVGEQRRRD
jgi:segregation and condensation protein B